MQGKDFKDGVEGLEVVLSYKELQERVWALVVINVLTDSFVHDKQDPNMMMGFIVVTFSSC